MSLQHAHKSLHMSTKRSHQIRATLTPHRIMNHRSIHEKQPLLIRHQPGT